MEEYCPTQEGNFTAYMPEYLDGDEWKTVPMIRSPNYFGTGVPEPLTHAGILRTICLCGYAQAQALSWQYAAVCDATPGMKAVRIRVQPYEVSYDIKAKKIESERKEKEG